MYYLLKPCTYLLFCLFLFSCENQNGKDVLAEADISMESTMITRGEYSFQNSEIAQQQTLIEFIQGQTKNKSIDMQGLSTNDFSYLVFYNANSEWAKPFSLSKFNQVRYEDFNHIIDTFRLEVKDFFKVQDDIFAISILPTTALEEPVELARDISMLNDIQMVLIKKSGDEDISTEAKNE